MYLLSDADQSLCIPMMWLYLVFHLGQKLCIINSVKKSHQTCTTWLHIQNLK